MQGNCTVSLVLLLCITCFPAHTHTLFYTAAHLNLRQLLFFLPVPNWQNVIICIVNRTQMSTTILRRGEVLYLCKIPLFSQPFIKCSNVHCLYPLCSFLIYHMASKHTDYLSIQELKKGSLLTDFEKATQETARSNTPAPITWRVFRLTESQTRTWGCKAWQQNKDSFICIWISKSD